MVGAQVTITDVQHGTSRSLVTTQTGDYVAPDLPAGSYKVRVEAKGFKTIERVNMPENIWAEIKARSTLIRCGVLLITTKVDPGYSGELTFGLFAVKFDFPLEMGARIANITFHEVVGETSSYRGQWQGGRVSTKGPEIQT